MYIDLTTVAILVWLASAVGTAWVAWQHGAHPVAYATVGVLLGPVGLLWAMWRFSDWGSGDDADG